MNIYRIVLLFSLSVITLLACNDSPQLPDVPEGAQTYSLLGDTLYTQDLDPDVEAGHRENLREAIADYRIDPESPENIIWLGRRTAYLGQYREAVEIFTEGIFKHSDDPRFYRHRGHRLLTLRQFDRAIEDFEFAEMLMRNMEDKIEPDGLPNELNQPTSTLKSNVWYHLGLAHYVKHDFQSAIEAYEKALELDLTEDMRIATLYWYYMALKRNGNDEKAGGVIADISPDIEIIENSAYLNLLLVFNAVFDADRFIEPAGDELQNATIGYGIGNWHFINGRQDRAFQIWQEIYDSGNWPAFGFIAAEAELSNSRES